MRISTSAATSPSSWGMSVKRVIAFNAAKAMKRCHLTKSEMAQEMRTRRGKKHMGDLEGRSSPCMCARPQVGKHGRSPFGEQETMPKVAYTKDNIEKCWCGSCPVQSHSKCAQDLYEESKGSEELLPPERL